MHAKYVKEMGAMIQINEIWNIIQIHLLDQLPDCLVK